MKSSNSCTISEMKTEIFRENSTSSARLFANSLANRCMGSLRICRVRNWEIFSRDSCTLIVRLLAQVSSLFFSSPPPPLYSPPPLPFPLLPLHTLAFLRCYLTTHTRIRKVPLQSTQKRNPPKNSTLKTPRSTRLPNRESPIPNREASSSVCVQAPAPARARNRAARRRGAQESARPRAQAGRLRFAFFGTARAKSGGYVRMCGCGRGSGRVSEREAGGRGGGGKR